VPLVRASRTPLASKYLRNASFLDSLAYTNPATTYPQKQTPHHSKIKSTAACIINTNKQTKLATQKHTDVITTHSKQPSAGIALPTTTPTTHPSLQFSTDRPFPPHWRKEREIKKSKEETIP
jgi:hypothetical protein